MLTRLWECTMRVQWRKESAENHQASQVLEWQGSPAGRPSGDMGSSQQSLPWAPPRLYPAVSCKHFTPQTQIPTWRTSTRKGKMQKFSIVSGYGFESTSAKLRSKGEYFKDGMGRGKSCLGRLQKQPSWALRLWNVSTTHKHLLTELWGLQEAM